MPRDTHLYKVGEKWSKVCREVLRSGVRLIADLPRYASRGVAAVDRRRAVYMMDALHVGEVVSEVSWFSS